MKNLILAACLMALSLTTAFSQTACCPYISPIVIIPAQPTTADTVRIVTVTTTPSLGNRVSYSFTMSADSIHLLGCFYAGPATALESFYDTTTIGPLPNGLYHIDYLGRIAGSQTTCTPVDSQIVHASFEVYLPNAVDHESLDENAISFSPNPTQDFLTINDAGEHKMLHYAMYNMCGQICSSGTFATTTRLDLSQMPNGIYVLKINGQGIHLAKRIIKN